MSRGKTTDISDETQLRDVHGMGPQTFTVLGVSGYNLRPSSTVADFKQQTGSFKELRETLSKGKMNYKYVLPKYQSLWNGSNPGGGTKRKASEAEMGPSNEEQTKQARTDSQINFLLAPKDGTPDTSAGAEYITNSTETPEVDAMTRTERDPDAEPVVEGDVAPKVAPFVIPDQSQIVSPDDKHINAPTLVLPEDPVPITPAIAIGESVFASRLVEALTEEEQAEEDLLGEALPSTKANGTKDLGGDGVGSLSYSDPIQPEEQEVKDSGIGASGVDGGSRFRSVALETASLPKFDDKEKIKAQDPRTASKHPFKQPALFRDHDMAVERAAIIEASSYNNRKLGEASIEALAQRDSSWSRWNQATQGVQCFAMPQGSSNFLQRGQMISDYQLEGVNPMQLTYSPSPFATSALLGAFGAIR